MASLLDSGNTGARTLTFVTSNAGKLREVQACLAGHIVVDAIKLDLPELQCCSVAEVSRNKALTAFERLKRPVLVEDTGLCFEALGGMPGPYVRWFIDSIGADGLARLLHGFDSRRAYTECVFTYCAAPDLLLQFHGRADGTISREPRGSGGFGFDCIFQPDEGDGRTFAEMSDSAKNEISHRSKALAALRKHFDHPAG
ncbi:putative Ham1 family [Trypanosoma vivax]|uniref:Inosine triphosphate pyrophosphatase n=1 Tax=Trypanosoma vivax (strain Y486) TaxID=1055687 RepID=G0U7T4_TRYVY|nr:hypothetical protein TRVL_00817 [Trypanosoma vivax]KAH8620688.1 putative Ham1 family [Trypanosoma vivax]CCC51942.1 conserved hypothetical protein [Trypanosoma vivax Y486]